MKPHEFHEDRDAEGECELCGYGAEHPIHELDGVAIEDDHNPREDEQRDDELTGDLREFSPPDDEEPMHLDDYPPTVASLFDSMGIRQP